MTQPVRLQLSRRKGFNLQSHSHDTNGLQAVNVARPSRWGNLWKVGLARCGCRSAGECDHNTFRCGTPAEAVEAYRAWTATWHNPNGRAGHIEELRGKNLACWCKPSEPCHADVLLELANQQGVGALPRRRESAPYIRRAPEGGSARRRAGGAP